MSTSVSGHLTHWRRFGFVYHRVGTVATFGFRRNVLWVRLDKQQDLTRLGWRLVRVALFGLMLAVLPGWSGFAMAARLLCVVVLAWIIGAIDAIKL